MQINLEWLRTFRAIYEKGTMSGAAKELFVSQPGIGLHLNALEAYTGFPLFERTARKMIPTERGALLYQQIFGAMSTLEQIEMRFKRKSGANRATVTLGMCEETFQQTVEKHIPTLPFNLIMQFADSEALIHSLEGGAVDFILSSAVSSQSNLVFQPLVEEKYILVSGSQTCLNAFQTTDKNQLLGWLNKQIWYSTAADMAVLNTFWEKNFNARPDFLPNYIVPNKFSILRCLSAGEGVAILPDFLCKSQIAKQQITTIWEGITPYTKTLFMGKRKHSLWDDEIACLEGILREAFV